MPIKLTSADFFAESCQIMLIFDTTHASASKAREVQTSSPSQQKLGPSILPAFRADAVMHLNTACPPKSPDRIREATGILSEEVRLHVR